MKHIIIALLIFSAACVTSEPMPLPVSSSEHKTVQDVNDPNYCESDYRLPVCELQQCPGFTQPCSLGFDYVDHDCDGLYPEDMGNGNVIDNCRNVCNPDQANSDTDHRGDVCDPCPFDPADDIDKDGICGDTDNCPAHHNPQQADADTDGFGDDCDQS